MPDHCSQAAAANRDRKATPDPRGPQAPKARRAFKGCRAHKVQLVRKGLRGRKEHPVQREIRAQAHVRSRLTAL